MARIVIVESKRVGELTRSLQEETARGCALSGSAFLDEELRETLQSYLVKSPKVERLLERLTFEFKTELAFALGVLSPDEYQGLGIVRKIRNRFAHHSEVRDFSSDTKVVEGCKRLYDLKLVHEPPVDNRTIFMNAVAYLFFAIRDEMNSTKPPEAKTDNFKTFDQRYSARLNRSPKRSSLT